MIDLARITLAVLSLLVLAGGLIGFVKAKSKASIIAGAVSSALLGACFVYSRSEPRGGLIAGDAVCVLLLMMFALRLRKGAKFMPSGLMMILSAIAATVVAVALSTG